MKQLDKGSKKLLNAWAFYDWANSVYALTIVSSIFPLFYSSLFNSKEDLVTAFSCTVKQETLITIVTAFTFLVVAIMSLILSGIADYVGNKKAFMKFFCYIGSAGCIGLYWFNLNYLYLSLLFYFMGLIGYWGSLVFYNSYLPDIAFKEQQDSISAKGFSLGYIGSVLLLLFNLALVMSQDDNAGKVKMMRYSFITVGVWWALFSQYTFYILPNTIVDNQKITKHVIFHGFKKLKLVWKQLHKNLKLKRYLYAFFVFSMAVQTIMLIAAYFGEKEIDWISDSQKTMGLIISILVIQLVAIVGAVLTSKSAYKYGNIKTLIVINLIWMCICVFAYFMVSPTEFYIAAAFVGLVMGGIQSLGRSTYSKFLPQNQETTSYFSFYDVTEKIGIVIGMLIFGIVSEYASMRYAILFLFTFFLLGVILLLRVPKESV